MTVPALQPTYNRVTQRLEEVAPAQISKGHYQQQWVVSSLFTSQADEQSAVDADLQSGKQAAVLKIDADTDALYSAVLGRRAEEYTSAASDAALYKSAGYTGTVPPGVASWATAKGWTATQAADDILVTAAAWIGAQNAIRAARLLRKEQVRTATNSAGVAEALAAWAGFLGYIHKALGMG